MRAILAALMLCVALPVHARWEPKYAEASQAIQEWYRNAELTRAAQHRLGYKSCCAHADVVRTRFRPSVSGGDGWEYLRPDGTWKRIPDDIIHWGKTGPRGEAVLFAIGGVETCFFPAQGGF